MLELLSVIEFSTMLMITSVSLLDILVVLAVVIAVIFLGGLFALMVKLSPWLLLVVAVVWVIKTIEAPKVP